MFAGLTHLHRSLLPSSREISDRISTQGKTAVVAGTEYRLHSGRLLEYAEAEATFSLLRTNKVLWY